MTGILELQAWIGFHEHIDEPFIIAAVSEDDARRFAYEAAHEAGYYAIEPDEFRLSAFYPLDRWAQTPAAKPGRCWTASVAVEDAMRAVRGPY